MSTILRKTDSREASMTEEGKALDKANILGETAKLAGQVGAELVGG